MIEKELLSIPEFAEAAGKKKQGIYEQAKNENSKLFPYVVSQGAKTLIKREALKEVYGIEKVESQDSQDSKEESKASQVESQEANQDSQTENQEESQENQPQFNPSNAQSEFSIVISILQKQLEEKDRQIERLQEQALKQAEESKKKDQIIQDQLDLLKNAQYIQAQSNVLLLGDKPEQGEPEETPVEEQKKKRSFWDRLFYGD